MRRSRTPTSRSSDRQRGAKLPVSFDDEVMPSLGRAFGAPIDSGLPAVLYILTVAIEPSIVANSG